ncbi:MAG: hypothetical protein IT422_07600 [Pirellulaceae bacterium]|jgi:hypothetical protein|nr:hypothetical protein [Pirellulaceae bacterium]
MIGDEREQLIAQLRPQWIDAVNAAWYNWRFVVAIVIPWLLFVAFTRFRWGGCAVFPFALLGCWFFISWGIYNVSDVMAYNAVTDDEFGLATSDTERTFAPFLSVPPVALIYTLLVFGIVAFLRMAFRIREEPRLKDCPQCARVVGSSTTICPRCASHLNAGTIDDGTDNGNPYRPPRSDE